MKKSLLMLHFVVPWGRMFAPKSWFQPFGPNNGVGDIVWDINAGGAHP
jgi:hypothetical protein